MATGPLRLANAIRPRGIDDAARANCRNGARSGPSRSRILVASVVSSRNTLSFRRAGLVSPLTYVVTDREKERDPRIDDDASATLCFAVASIDEPNLFAATDCDRVNAINRRYVTALPKSRTAHDSEAQARVCSRVFLLPLGVACPRRPGLEVARWDRVFSWVRGWIIAQKTAVCG